MYGISEIEEDFDFVSFLSDSISKSIKDNKTDLTGLDLDLEFPSNTQMPMSKSFLIQILEIKL